MMTLSAACSLLLVMAAPPTVPEPAEVRSKLDAALEAKWKALNLVPEARADDATFLRRVYLDLTGRVPAPLKTREFLDDKDPNKRARLVEALLGSEEFADHWARVLTQRLTERRPIKHEKYDARVLQQYLREATQANKSYRAIVTELITGEGVSDASGPANFLLRYEAKPADLAGAVGQQFLGVSLQCAQCHDHPFAKWKQNDFWGVAAFFGRLRLLESADDSNEYVTAIVETRRGELQVPDLKAKPDEQGQIPKKKVMPRLPIENSLAIPDKRRPALAAWITADSNPYFARHAVNRVWTHFLGIPLVEPLDRPGAEGSGKHPQILAMLADDFAAGGHDIKRLARIIVLSRAYQLSAGGTKTEDADPQAERRAQQVVNFARFPVRSLTVDQLHASIVQATGHKGDEGADPAAKKEEDEEGNDLPVELLGERGLTVQRALTMLNSEYVHKAVQSGAKTTQTVNGRAIGAAHVDWLFLATLARRPSADEAKTMLELARGAKGMRGLEDVLWVLLNSAEFNTNH